VLLVPHAVAPTAPVAIIAPPITNTSNIRFAFTIRSLGQVELGTICDRPRIAPEDVSLGVSRPDQTFDDPEKNDRHRPAQSPARSGNSLL
jgi:hypothetical protein